MTQLERISRITDYLIDEILPAEQRNGVRSRIATGDMSPRELMRTLLTVRQPGPLPSHVMEGIDEILEAESTERGAVEALSLPTLAKTMGIDGPLGEHVALWRGDLTQLRADAIVNAANEQMLGCFVPGHSCIDNVIHSVAGPALREECAAHMKRQGTLEPTGTVTVTRGYHLPAAYVFHTVGPIVSGELTSSDRDLLASSYVSILDEAERREDVATIGLCSVSTGVFGFPKDAAAHVVVETISRWLAEHPDTDLRIIISAFADIDEHVYTQALINGGTR